MPNDEQPVTPAAAAEVRPDGQPTATPGTATPDGGLVLTAKEWADYRREQRTDRDKLREDVARLAAALAATGAKPPTPEAPPAPAAEATTLRAQMAQMAEQLAAQGRESALHRVLSAQQLSEEERTLLEALDKADKKKPEELAEWAASRLALIRKGKAPPTSAPTAAPIPPGRSNTGPAGSPSPIVAPGTLAGIDPAVYKAIPLEERKKLSGQFMQSGAHANPYRRIK
jgi:hypothetical protein